MAAYGHYRKSRKLYVKISKFLMLWTYIIKIFILSIPPKIYAKPVLLYSEKKKVIL